jgi:hypothetical protein
LFFRDMVNNGEGRRRQQRPARFLEEAAKVHDFTADGMLDVGGRRSALWRHPSGEERCSCGARRRRARSTARGHKAVNVTFE